MSNLEYVKLSDVDVQREVALLDGWSRTEGHLAKIFAFDRYLDGVAFASRVGHAAEALDHHPEIAIGYRKVHVRMQTHAVSGLSPYDFELARRIEALAADDDSKPGS